MRASGRQASLGSIADAARLTDFIPIETMGKLDLQRTGALLGAAQAELEVMKVGPSADAAARDGEAADTSIYEARQLTSRERAKGAAPQEQRLAASEQVDATRNDLQLAGGKLEEILRRALAAARRDLDAMRRVAERQRQRAETLARDLTVVLRLAEELEAKAAGAMRSKAAALRARDAAEAALADERRTLVEARQKLGAYERDLAAAGRSSAAPEPDAAHLAAAEIAAVVLARQIAEAAARRTGEELALEREKARLLARDLDTARQERDAAIRAAQRRAIADGGDLAQARQSAAFPEPDANVGAAETAAAVLARHMAEAAVRRAGEELALERKKARSLARELDTARRERDAAVQAARRRVIADGRDRGGGRERVAVPKEIHDRKPATARQRAGIQPAPSALPDALLPRRLVPGLW
ncbi:hypothetical protein [Sinorhizobium glycinis]|nr:hypothetical protein [Sinorhizobium glycinis]